MQLRSMTLVSVLAALLAGGCDRLSTTSEAEAEAEKLPEIVPDLPEVPTLPPPPHPVTYEDESFSVYGIRNRLRHTLDTDVAVTGYIVDVYEPPVCKEKKKEDCPVPLAPHMWLADTPDETEREKELIVVGYADNQEQLDKAKRGRKATTIDGTIIVPRNLEVGEKVQVKGRFTLISSGGFNTSNGLLEYNTHETVEQSSAE